MAYDHMGNVCTGDIRAIQADGTGDRLVINSPACYDLTPAWSPDSSEIVFHRTGIPGEPNTNAGLTLVRPDGTQLTFLTSDNGFDPNWQPLQTAASTTTSSAPTSSSTTTSAPTTSSTIASSTTTSPTTTSSTTTTTLRPNQSTTCTALRTQQVRWNAYVSDLERRFGRSFQSFRAQLNAQFARALASAGCPTS